MNHFNCQVQKPSSYPLKLFVRRCHHWQSLTGGGRATGMQISFVLESCWAARRPKWTGAHLLFLSLIVRYVSKIREKITLRLCSSSCCCFTRGRENVSAVISESEQCPHRVGRSLISSGKVKELKLDEGRMKRNVTAEESSDTDRRALLKSGRQLWHHQTINNQRIDRSRPQSCPAFRVQMMLRQHSSGPLWGS